MADRVYLISEIVKKYNISPRTLKFYEETGLIKSTRNKKNIRVYDDIILNKLEQILIFKKMGISIKNMKMIFDTNNQHEIMNIISRQKDFLKNEIYQLTEMKEQISVFITQIENQAVNSHEIAESCVPKQRWDIDLSEMHEALSNEGKREPETSDKLEIESIAGEDVLVLLSNASKYAVSSDKYTMPLTVYITAKINNRNLWLFFGGHRIAFVKEAGGIRLFYHDYVLDCNLEAFQKGDFSEEYLNIKWSIRKESVTVFLNEELMLCLEYSSSYDSEIISNIGIGADHGNEIVLKDMRVEDETNNIEKIALSNIKWRQYEHYINNGELKIFNTIDRITAGTSRKFSLPLKIDLTAKTDNTNIRIYYHNGGVILNWEKERGTLRIADVYDSSLYMSKSGGYITPNEYHNISWILHSDFMALTVDGIIRFYSKEAFYMDHIKEHSVTDIVRIGTAFESTMTVKNLSITELEM